jgi:periplasmic divalent cation tolerance protein
MSKQRTTLPPIPGAGPPAPADELRVDTDRELGLPSRLDTGQPSPMLPGEQHVMRWSVASDERLDGDLVVLLTSCPPDAAGRIADHLIGANLAACVSVIEGVRSHYRWRGRVEREAETLLLIKTPSTRLDECAAVLSEVHPYEVPELVALPSAAVGAAYLRWARSVT